MNSRRISHLFIASLLVASTVGVQGAQGFSLSKKKVPATKAKGAAKVVAGSACTKLGERAAGTSLDCVKVGNALKWQPYGSRLNPIKLNEPARYSGYEKNQYSLKITGITALTVADINPGGTGKYPIPAGMSPFKIGAELTYLGPNDSNDLPAYLTDLDVVDKAGRKFGTYAGDDKSGGECEQFGDYPSNGTRGLQLNVPLTSGLCVVMTSGPTDGILVNISWLDDPNGLWFKTS